MKRTIAAAALLLLAVSAVSGGETRVEIRDIQQEAVPPYTWVLVESVAVTGVLPDGFFIQEEGGGPWSGIWVNRQETPAVAAGDRVRVRGYAADIGGLTLISATDALGGTVEVLGDSRAAPEAEKIAPSAIGEPYEGVLVSVEVLVVLGPPAGGEWLALSIGEGAAGDTVRVGLKASYEPPAPGDTLAAVTGAVHTAAGAYRIEPRGGEDVLSMNEATGAEGGAPARFHVYGCRPNPFNPSTQIAFDLPSEGRTRADVYDLSGRRVRLLLDRSLPAGSHVIRWDGRDARGEDAPSSVYFCRVTHEERVETIKMILVR